MQIIDIKGKKWLVGLEWEILPDDQSFKIAAKEVAAKTNSNVGILVTYDEQFAIGLSKKGSKVPSAATALAYANQDTRSKLSDSERYLDWIVVEEVADDKFWIAVIKNGIPAPTYDAVLDITTVKDKITELLINDTYKLYSTCSEIRSIFDGLKQVEELGLNALTQDIKIKNDFRKLRGIPDSLIYMGFGFMCLLAVGYAVSQFFEGRSLAEKAANYERQQQEQIRLKQEQYQLALKDYNKLKEDMRQKAIKDIAIGIAASPPSVLTNWYDTIGGIEMKTHGWTLDSMECYMIAPVGNISQKSACDIKYKRTGLSTNRMILEDYPEIRIQGNEAILTVPVELKNTDLIQVSENDLERFPTAKNWGFNMISQLQLLKIVNIDSDIKSSSDITYIAPPKPINPNEPPAAQGATQVEAPISVGISKGEIIISNNNYELIKEIAENVQFFGVGVKSASFKMSALGDINWEVRMEYFVKNDEHGGIAGSDSSKLSNSSVPQKDENGQIKQQ